MSDEHQNFSSRIIDGSDATIRDYPYQLSVRLARSSRPGDHGHWCGGSILTVNRGLTASRCMTYPETRYNIKAGTTYCRDLPNQKSQIRQVTRYLNREESDISILFWEIPLVFGAKVQPVILAQKDHAIPYGQLGHISGWGRAFEEESWLPDTLQATEIPFMQIWECREMLSGITATMICAGFPEGGRSACAGDFGGPLVQRIDNKFIQIGVMSFTKGCGRPRSPTVHTSIPHFYDWIHENL